MVDLVIVWDGTPKTCRQLCVAEEVRREVDEPCPEWFTPERLPLPMRVQLPARFPLPSQPGRRV